jgi:hypothetical protein
MGFVLFIVSLILLAIVFAISFVLTPIYYIITLKWKSGFKQLDRWFYKMALSIDQFGNVACAKVLKLMFTKRNGHDFGDEDDTVSYVLGRNQYKKTLTGAGRLMVKILDRLEENHCTIAIFKKMERDQEAVDRLTKDEYFK